MRHLKFLSGCIARINDLVIFLCNGAAINLIPCAYGDTFRLSQALNAEILHSQADAKLKI